MGGMFANRAKGAIPITLEGEELEQAIQDGWVQKTEEDGVDTIWILPKMNYGQKQKLLGSVAKLNVSNEQLREMRDKAKQREEALARGEVVPTEDDAAIMGAMTGGMDMGAYNNEKLVLNVVSWAGPSFKGVKVTRENVLDLDPDNPLVVKVVAEIDRRNAPRKGGPSPK